MSIGEMLEQSAVLTLLGMCVVFSFLIILIGCMNALRAFVHAKGWDKEKEEKVVSPAAPVASSAPAVDTNAIVAAIATAVREKENE